MPHSIEATPFPLDFAVLRKGDTITTNRLADILECAPPDRLFSIKLLGLKEQVERELAARSMPVTISCAEDSLHILTDEEAVDYNARQFDHGRRQLMRSHVRLQNVDRGQLSDGQRDKHDRLLITQGAQIVALREARKRLLIAPHKSQTPSMLPNGAAGRSGGEVGGGGSPAPSAEPPQTEQSTERA